MTEREAGFMSCEDESTEALIQRIVQGDQSASQLLLARHRDRLKNMVAVRMDRRLLPRLDPSDVVQETLAEAWQQLADYVQHRPIPFYPWLRQLAWQRLIAHHRRHVKAQKRSVKKEQHDTMRLPDQSELQLANRLAFSGTSPSGKLMRKELRLLVKKALRRLSEQDRELLVLKYLECLSTVEIAAVLGTTEAAVKMRHLRAMQRLRETLDREG
jgi:RNA polymerase sigma-70 factor (ECF subfamily)